MSVTTNDTTFDLAELLWGDAPVAKVRKPRKARKPAKRVGISREVARLIWGDAPAKPSLTRTTAKSESLA